MIPTLRPARRARGLALALSLALAGACGGDDEVGLPAGIPDPAQNSYAASLGINLQSFQRTGGGVYYQDVQTGSGATAASRSRATVHYTGWLPNGSKFDSSRDRGQPFVFTIDGNEVIRGWDEGVKGMRVGGRRKLVIPAALGYGSQGAGSDIPPNSTLVFDIELLGVQ